MSLSRRKIRLGFWDFWGGFDPHNNYFTQLLEPHYELEISDQPDFLIFSVFGHRHLEHRGVRILFAGENERPDLTRCDYAFSNDHLEDARHFRLPLYALTTVPEDLIKEKQDLDEVLASKSGFCNFVYSGYSKERVLFMLKLSRYRQVSIGGRLLNNVGGPVPDKRAFLQRFKFTIAFENGSHPGYTTEKIIDPMLVDSIPIYWGNPLIHLDFNPASFVNTYDYASDEEVIKRIIEIDNNPTLFRSYLGQPWYHQNTVNRYIEPAAVLAHFQRIFDHEGPVVADLATGPATVLKTRRRPSIPFLGRWFMWLVATVIRPLRFRAWLTWTKVGLRLGSKRQARERS